MKKSKIEDRGSTIAIRPPPFSIFHPRSLVFVALFFALLHSARASALEVPPLRGRINDLAGILPADRAQLLEQRLAFFEKETGHQIAVLTIPSLEGDPLEDFSIRVAESWKIGQKGFDNGAILLIAQKERKLRIEVGYGLEGVLPDAIASRIIREVIVPRFRANDYAGGIEAGVDAVVQVARGESLANNSIGPTSASELNMIWVTIVLLAILVLPRIIMWRLVMPSSRARGATIGGAVGAILGGLTSVASMILGIQVSSTAIGLLFLLAVVIGVVSGLQGFLRSSRVFGSRKDVQWNEPFYLGNDGISMASLQQRSGGVRIAPGSAGGALGSGFSGGGGRFGGGGASGGW